MLPSMICNLLNLQILKLLGCCWLKELPKDLGNLKDLRYLELDEMFWYKCSTLPPKIGGLINLHNLHRFHVLRKSGHGIEELKSMKNVEGLLHISKLENSVDAKEARLKQKEGITKLVLEWSKEEDSMAQEDDRTAQESVLDDLEPHVGLQELHIQQYEGSRFSSWMGNGLLQNLYKISLIHCVNCRTLCLGPLPHLKQIIIKGMLELEEWAESTTYMSLYRLTISNCPKLWKLPHRSFLAAKVMKIKQCPALKAFTLTPYLQFLVLVNNDCLEEWSETSMVTIVDKDNEGTDKLTLLESSRSSQENNNTLEEDESDVSFVIVTKELGGLEDGQACIRGSFSNLLELTMVNCPRMQKLPQSFAPQKLKISGCPLLTTLPNLAQNQRLQYLELDKCNGPSLIEAMQSSDSLDALTISNITTMAQLPKLPHFPKLLSLYIHNYQNLESLSHEDGLLQNFTSLKFLSISGCPNLVTFLEGLPPSIDCLIINNCSNLQSFHGRSRNLTSLKDLYLEDCPKLESLPEDGVPDSLRHLRIRGCSLLTQQCNKDVGGRYWKMISHVADLELDF